MAEVAHEDKLTGDNPFSSVPCLHICFLILRHDNSHKFTAPNGDPKILELLKCTIVFFNNYFFKWQISLLK
jgi:hypothetical protein